MADNKRLASRLMMDAFDAVEQGHKEHWFRHWAAHTASQAYRGMGTSEKAALGVGVGIGAGVAIASAVVTAGLSVPILLALGAGTYALKKLIGEVGMELGRQNRNWLQRYHSAAHASQKEHGNFLTCEAKDAIRRAVDHYLITQKVLKTELEKYYAPDYGTCEDAVNHAKAVARFIHHADKTRNYLLPCLDMCIFYLREYAKLADNWQAHQRQIDAALTRWFDYHQAVIIGTCAADPKKHVCYAPASTTSDEPRHPHPKGGKTWNVSSDNPVVGESVDIVELAEALEDARNNKLIAALRRSDNTPAATWNYSAARPEHVPFVEATQGATVRMQALVEDVWKQADQPGYFARTGRKLGHMVSRRTGLEIFAGLFAEALDIGMIFVPFLNNAKLDDIVRGVVKGSVTGGETLVTQVGAPVLTSLEKLPIKSDLLNMKAVQDAVEKDAKSSGFTVQGVLPKVFTHFANALNGIQEIEGKAITIRSCQEAWVLANKQAEIIHELNKVNKHLLCAVGLVVQIGAVTASWVEKEHDVWRIMEEDVWLWVHDWSVHQECRDKGKHCYGQRVTRYVRGGSFSSFIHGRYDATVDWRTPHKRV